MTICPVDFGKLSRDRVPPRNKHRTTSAPPSFAASNKSTTDSPPSEIEKFSTAQVTSISSKMSKLAK